MDREFWINRWVENKIGFHRAGVNPQLEQFWPATGVPEAARTLVPLCGKSDDLCWLAERGHDVVGVELSEIAVRAFSSEQRIRFVESAAPPFTVFRSPRLTIYAGDFFDFSRASSGEFDAFYDRAALIALPPTMRPQYVQQLSGLLSCQARGLLITVEYDPVQMDGPPFSVDEREVRSLWNFANVEKLLEFDCLEEEPRFKERGLQWMKESVYRIARKS